MNIRNTVSAFLAIASLLVACGPSATFQAAQQQAAGAAQNTVLERANTRIRQLEEANRRLATGQAPAQSDATAPAATAAVPGIAPVAAPGPQMPRLCAGVDPSLLNVRSFETMRTESQGFGGVYNPGGNTINGLVFLQNTQFWMTIVVNDQVQTATTGPMNQEFGGMILVRHASGTCLTPAYAPEGARRVRFTPNSAMRGQRLEIRCYARQMDPTTGTWRVADFRGRRVWDNWDPADTMVPEMQDWYCR